jgi:hypothetical protein
MEAEMKQRSLTKALVAALLTIAGSAAYGQDRQTTAKIPFAFRAVGSDLPAGNYKVVHGTGYSVNMQLQNIDTGKSVLLHAKSSIANSEKHERPRLVFECGGEAGCTLARLFEDTGRGLEFPTQRLTANQRERRETIYLDRFREK